MRTLFALALKAKTEKRKMALDLVNQPHETTPSQ